MIDIFSGGLYQEHHVDLRPTSLRWKVKLLSFYIFSLMSQMQVKQRSDSESSFSRYFYRECCRSKEGLWYIWVYLLQVISSGSKRKNYPARDNWRQFWFCRRQNLWSVTILAQYLSRGNYDLKTTATCSTTCTTSQYYHMHLYHKLKNHRVVLSYHIYLPHIMTTGWSYNLW